MMDHDGRPEEELQFISVPANSMPTATGFDVPNQPLHPSSQQPAQGEDAFAFIKATRHPVAAAFHYLFKTLALFFYMFGWMFSSNFVFICVVCILLLAFDFWTVKNITGRLLVGLRWWNVVKDDGTNEWRFESVENPNEVHPTDARLFWWGMYITPIVWLLLFLIALLKFNIQWMVIVLVALVLNGANIVGYYKCSKDQKKKVQSLVQGGAMFSALGGNAVTSLIVSAFGGGSSSSSQQTGAMPPV